MKVYVIPVAVMVRIDTKDMLCSSKGFTSDDDIFDETSGGSGDNSSSNDGSYNLPIV